MICKVEKQLDPTRKILKFGITTKRDITSQKIYAAIGSILPSSHQLGTMHGIRLDDGSWVIRYVEYEAAPVPTLYNPATCEFFTIDGFYSTVKTHPFH